MIPLRRTLMIVLLALGVTVVFADDDVAAASASQTVSPETLKAVDQSKRLFVAALKLKGKERIIGLRQSYQKLVEASQSDSMLAPPRTMWAKMLMSVGDRKGAQASLQRAALESPGDPEAFVMLAGEAIRAGQFVEAELAYDAAILKIEALPSDHFRRQGMIAQVESGLATVSEAKSRLATEANRASYQQATLKHLRNWVAAAPNNANAHNRLAVALLIQGELDEAVESFDHARQLNPKFPVTDLRLAQSQIAKGDVKAAMASLDRAVIDHPNDLNVRSTAADLLLLLGDLDAAEAQLEAALKIDADDLGANRLNAQLSRFRRQWSTAAQHLQTLNNEHPTDFETANLLALTLTELESEDARSRAVSISTVTAQRFDANTREGRRARITLIWAAFAAGQTDAAKVALERLLSVGIQSNQISGDEGYFLSRLLVEFGRPEVASAMLTSTLSRLGSFPKRSEAEALAAQLQ
ncbi:MAG: tetratricopeptide repeat protein [Planctomycetota bacterium]